jgi:phosphoglycolate phosphatase
MEALLLQALAHATQSPVDVVRNRPDLTQIKKRFDFYYQHHCGTNSRVYPQVREVLEQLKARGVKLTIVTNKNGQYADLVLKAHGLCEFFDMVISGDALPVKKPDPAGVFECLKFFSVKPEQALFVGDSSIDAATARHAGVKVWLLNYGYNMNQPVEASLPDRVVENILPLLGY